MGFSSIGWPWSLSIILWGYLENSFSLSNSSPLKQSKVLCFVLSHPRDKSSYLRSKKIKQKRSYSLNSLLCRMFRTFLTNSLSSSGISTTVMLKSRLLTIVPKSNSGSVTSDWKISFGWGGTMWLLWEIWSWKRPLKSRLN